MKIKVNELIDMVRLSQSKEIINRYGCQVTGMFYIRETNGERTISLPKMTVRSSGITSYSEEEIKNEILSYKNYSTVIIYFRGHSKWKKIGEVNYE